MLVAQFVHHAHGVRCRLFGRDLRACLIHNMEIIRLDELVIVATDHLLGLITQECRNRRGDPVQDAAFGTEDHDIKRGFGQDSIATLRCFQLLLGEHLTLHIA